MAYRVYAAVVDDGVYADPTTFWLEVGTWTWRTRNYAGGTWSIDSTIGGTYLVVVDPFISDSFSPYTAEPGYFPFGSATVLVEYISQAFKTTPSDWVPSLYFKLPIVELNGNVSISESFYGSVVFTADSDLVRTQ